MNQGSRSDLQPYRDGSDAPLSPVGLRGNRKPCAILELYGRYTQIYHDQRISGDV